MLRTPLEETGAGAVAPWPEVQDEYYMGLNSDTRTNIMDVYIYIFRYVYMYMCIDSTYQYHFETYLRLEVYDTAKIRKMGP